MQSIFRLPWCTDHFGPGDKAVYGPGALPVDVSGLKKLKRKRAVTPDPQIPQRSDAKKQRPATAIASEHFSVLPTTRVPVATPPVTLEEAKSDAKSILQPESATRQGAQETHNENMAAQDVEMANAQVCTTTRLQQAIENQLNLQILMKHNELRLIDQELAKCQIALEQLRRCEMRPFPGDSGFDYSISSGTGSAVLPQPGFTQPSHAAPHGVVDGPYSRHYRRWLLPDSQFDSQPVYASPVEDAGRSTRHAGVRKSVATPLRGESLQSLPSFPAPAPRKDSSTPLVLRRSTDNKLVKLVCNNCGRGNMSSIQGFLNHCRIAHKVIYESHDSAAIDCGVILDDAEIATLPAEAQSMPIAKPVVKHTPSRQASVAVPVISAQSVHPLNQPGAKVKPSKEIIAKPATPLSMPQHQQHAQKPFKPAVGLPKLSAIFARRSCGGDLDQAVWDARKKSELFDDLSPASMTPGSPAVVTPTGGRGMLAVNGRVGGKQPQPPQHSYFAQQSELVQSPGEFNLSPHTDGNPGLVSDVEDDDNGSASEEESHAPHAPMPPFGVRRDCTDNMDIDVVDGVDQHGVVIRRNSSAEERNTVGGSSRKFGN